MHLAEYNIMYHVLFFCEKTKIKESAIQQIINSTVPTYRTIWYLSYRTYFYIVPLSTHHDRFLSIERYSTAEQTFFDCLLFGLDFANYYIIG
jgi:hypothetical protein